MLKYVYQPTEPLEKKMNYESNVALNWERFKRKFDIYIEAFYEGNVAESKKIAMFLHVLGDEGYEIYTSFNMKEEDMKQLNYIIDRFDEHFTAKVNITYERYTFFNRNQKENDTYEQYVTVLKNLSNSCRFKDLRHELVKDIFVSGIRDKDAKDILLKTQNLTLEKVLDISRERNIASKHARELNKEEEVNVHYLKKRKERGYNKEERNKCDRSGTTHGYKQCTYMVKKCSNCGSPNYFAKMCKALKKKKTKKKGRQNMVSEVHEESSDSEYVIDIVKTVKKCLK
ncbi:hypothetical protein MML48_6g00007389 [Holotrichia oblita]|uniref:Uncharacterized protein n=1 Tax=Holotrichia oblita TaxID=644536 RepID=A0ACB9SZ27_HOLOL|nr:hypothetical protein MML48_6g00007389 [Holotrichia oblita]